MRWARRPRPKACLANLVSRAWYRRRSMRPMRPGIEAYGASPNISTGKSSSSSAGPTPKDRGRSSVPLAGLLHGRREARSTPGACRCIGLSRELSLKSPTSVGPPTDCSTKRFTLGFGRTSQQRKCGGKSRAVKAFSGSARGRTRGPVGVNIFKDQSIIRLEMVGVRGFEPPTPSSRTMCATRLRYTPTSRTFKAGEQAL